MSSLKSYDEQGNQVEVLKGTRVYQAYAPQRAGVVLEDLGPAGPCGYFRHLRIRWLGGETTHHSSGHLNDFDALIADHQKKLATHLKTLEKLKALEVL
jgi:hypothetical protein